MPEKIQKKRKFFLQFSSFQRMPKAEIRELLEEHGAVYLTSSNMAPIKVTFADIS